MHYGLWRLGRCGIAEAAYSIAYSSHLACIIVSSEVQKPKQRIRYNQERKWQLEYRGFIGLMEDRSRKVPTSISIYIYIISCLCNLCWEYESEIWTKQFLSLTAKSTLLLYEL